MAEIDHPGSPNVRRNVLRRLRETYSGTTTSALSWTSVARLLTLCQFEASRDIKPPTFDVLCLPHPVIEVEVELVVKASIEQVDRLCLVSGRFKVEPNGLMIRVHMTEFSQYPSKPIHGSPTACSAVDAKNLTDTTYRLWHYMWQPGRTVTVAVESSF